MHLLGLSLIALLCNTFLVCYSFSGGKLCVAISIDISLWASFNIIKPCLSLEKFQFLPHGFCLWCYYNYNSLYLFQHVHLGLIFLYLLNLAPFPKFFHLCTVLLLFLLLTLNCLIMDVLFICYHHWHCQYTVIIVMYCMSVNIHWTGKFQN